jgi:hypothetical protein
MTARPGGWFGQLDGAFLDRVNSHPQIREGERLVHTILHRICANRWETFWLNATAIAENEKRRTGRELKDRYIRDKVQGLVALGIFVKEVDEQNKHRYRLRPVGDYDAVARKLAEREKDAEQKRKAGLGLGPKLAPKPYRVPPEQLAFDWGDPSPPRRKRRQAAPDIRPPAAPDVRPPAAAASPPPEAQNPRESAPIGPPPPPPQAPDIRPSAAPDIRPPAAPVPSSSAPDRSPDQSPSVGPHVAPLEARGGREGELRSVASLADLAIKLFGSKERPVYRGFALRLCAGLLEHGATENEAKAWLREASRDETIMHAPQPFAVACTLEYKGGEPGRFVLWLPKYRRRMLAIAELQARREVAPPAASPRPPDAFTPPTLVPDGAGVAVLPGSSAEPVPARDRDRAFIASLPTSGLIPRRRP